MAITVNVYAVPAVKPVKIHDVFVVFIHPAGAVTDGEEVTVYPVTTDPPFEDGADQEILARLYEPATVTPVGAPGTVAGVTAADAEDGLEFPLPLIAITVNVYAVPLVRPVKVQERFDVFVHPAGAETKGEDVTV